MGHDQSTPIAIAGRQVRMKSKIAEGGYSFVYLVEDMVTLETFALKRCVAADSNARKLIEQEIRLLETVCNGKYPFMVRYLGSVQRESKNAREYLILMEYCSGGSVITEMQHAMDHGKRFSEEKIFHIFVSAMRALNVLHSMSPPCAHRDIKIENILISGSDYKLCDFGSCTNQAKLCQSSSEIIAEQDIIERHSTMMYRAPEMCDLYRARSKQWTLNEKVDIWAMGCVMYTLLYFKHPFEDGGVLGILSGKLDFPAAQLQNYSKFPAYIASQCFTVDPSVRPSATSILSICTAWHHYLKTKSYNDPALEETLKNFVPGVVVGNDPKVTSNTAAALAAATAAASGAAGSSVSTPATRPARSLRPAPAVPATTVQTSNSTVVSAVHVAANDDFDVDWDETPAQPTQQSTHATTTPARTTSIPDPFADNAPASVPNPRARVRPTAAASNTNASFEVTFADDEWAKDRPKPVAAGGSGDWGAFVAGTGAADIFGFTASPSQAEAKVASPEISISVSPSLSTQTPTQTKVQSHVVSSPFTVPVSSPFPAPVLVPSPSAASVQSRGSAGQSSNSNSSALDIFGSTISSNQAETAERVNSRSKQYASADLTAFISGSSPAAPISSPAVTTTPQPQTISLDAIQNPLELLELTKSRSTNSNQSQSSRGTLSAIDAMYAASAKPREQPNYF